jgi:hypothetical protein
MTALTAERATVKRDGKLNSDPVAATKKLYAGALACLDANGNLTPGAVATTLKARGMVRFTVDNTSGADGAVNGETETGVFKFANSTSGDLIARADIGNTCYIVDDQTVAKTNGTNTRSTAGTIQDVDADGGVWVKVG